MKRLAIAMSLLLVLVGCGNSSGETSESQSNQPSSSPKWEENIKAKVEQYSVSRTSCSYSDGSLEVIVNFTNVSAKKIIAVTANAKINDVFGEEIMSLNLSLDEAIAPNASVKSGSTGSSCFSLSDVDSDESRLMEMDLKTTALVVTVSRIAFADGEILEF